MGNTMSEISVSILPPEWNPLLWLLYQWGYTF